jgi:hypothetical protein
MALPPRGSPAQGPTSRRAGANAHESSHRGRTPHAVAAGTTPSPQQRKTRMCSESYMARAGPGGGGNSGRAPAHTLCGLAALLDEVPDVAAHLLAA